MNIRYTLTLQNQTFESGHGKIKYLYDDFGNINTIIMEQHDFIGSKDESQIDIFYLDDVRAYIDKIISYINIEYKDKWMVYVYDNKKTNVYIENLRGETINRL